MPSNKKRLKSANLYLILDTQVLSYQQLLVVLKDAVRFGIDIVQLRDKFGLAKDILAFCRKAKAICKDKTLFIVNDRIDLAILTGADGVHLGQGDISYAQARCLMGPKANYRRLLPGFSTGQTCPARGGGLYRFWFGV